MNLTGAVLKEDGTLEIARTSRNDEYRDYTLGPVDKEGSTYQIRGVVVEWTYITNYRDSWDRTVAALAGGSSGSTGGQADGVSATSGTERPESYYYLDRPCRS